MAVGERSFGFNLIRSSSVTNILIIDLSYVHEVGHCVQFEDISTEFGTAIQISAGGLQGALEGVLGVKFIISASFGHMCIRLSTSGGLARTPYRKYLSAHYEHISQAVSEIPRVVPPNTTTMTVMWRLPSHPLTMQV